LVVDRNANVAGAATRNVSARVADASIHSTVDASRAVDTDIRGRTRVERGIARIACVHRQGNVVDVRSAARDQRQKRNGDAPAGSTRRHHHEKNGHPAAACHDESCRA
jgi:hypothetical protein